MYKISKQISIHALLAESDIPVRQVLGFGWHFYPRSPCGERRVVLGQQVDNAHFYPRSPCGERQSGNPSWIPFQQFLSTLSLRRATAAAQRPFRYYPISIHALLAESDPHASRPRPVVNISIHALLAESDPKIKVPPCTLSVYFYPRSPCGERLNITLYQFAKKLFLSTLSLRRATKWQSLLDPIPAISIHALLAESER